MLRCVRWITIVLAALTQSRAAVTEPPWLLAGYPGRAVFRVDGRPGPAVVRLRAAAADHGFLREDGQSTGFSLLGPQGNPLPLRALHVRARSAMLLIDPSQNPAGGECALYYGADSESTAGNAPGLHDSQPWIISLRKTDSKGMPTTWSRMSYLWSCSSEVRLSTSRCASPGSLDLAALGAPLPTEEKTPRRSGGNRLQALVRVSSVLLVPAKGIYRFGLDCRDAGFLLVDGEVAAARLAEHFDGEWLAGPPLLLDDGPHRVEVVSMGGWSPAIRVGWMPVSTGSTRIEPVPSRQFVAAREIVDVRTERSDRSLHAHFISEPGRAYALRTARPPLGYPVVREPAPVFVPVELRNNSRDWNAGRMVCSWRFPREGSASENPVLEGESVKHVFPGAELHRAVLEVRDESGLSAAIEREIDCRDPNPREYLLAFDCRGMPPVCYESDLVQPALRLQGSMPSGAQLKVSWTVVDRAGRSRTDSEMLQLAGQARDIPIARCRVRNIKRLEWSVTHRDVVLEADSVRFLRSPFADLPATVEADMIRDKNGDRLVLVPARRAGRFRQPAISRDELLSGVVLVDDMLYPADPGPDGSLQLARGVPTRVVRLPPYSSAPHAYGPLLKLAAVPAAALGEERVVVLSVGLNDLLGLKDADVFERHAAALTDMLSETGKRRVIWLTPPPYPLHTDRARAFARAVRLVADARGIPVADLYTAFHGLADPQRPLLHPGESRLTDRGRQVAAQAIARALDSARNPGRRTVSAKREARDAG